MEEKNPQEGLMSKEGNAKTGSWTIQTDDALWSTV